MLEHALKRIPGAGRMARFLGLRAKGASSDRDFLLETFPKDSIGAEIGVHLGDFSQRILDSVSPRELHLIDPWEHQPSSAYRQAWYGGGAKRGQTEMDERHASVVTRFGQSIDEGRVHVHRGHSAEVLRQFPDQYFDWVYIDGNHLYEYVKKDLELAFQKVKVGGYVSGDDYTQHGWWEGGVKKAVDEFAENESVRLVALRNSQFLFLRKAGRE